MSDQRYHDLDHQGAVEFTSTRKDYGDMTVTMTSHDPPFNMMAFQPKRRTRWKPRYEAERNRRLKAEWWNLVALAVGALGGFGIGSAIWRVWL